MKRILLLGVAIALLGSASVASAQVVVNPAFLTGQILRVSGAECVEIAGGERHGMRRYRARLLQSQDLGSCVHSSQIMQEE